MYRCVLLPFSLLTSCCSYYLRFGIRSIEIAFIFFSLALPFNAYLLSFTYYAAKPPFSTRLRTLLTTGSIPTTGLCLLFHDYLGSVVFYTGSVASLAPLLNILMVGKRSVLSTCHYQPRVIFINISFNSMPPPHPGKTSAGPPRRPCYQGTPSIVRGCLWVRCQGFVLCPSSRYHPPTMR